MRLAGMPSAIKIRITAGDAFHRKRLPGARPAAELGDCTLSTRHPKEVPLCTSYWTSCGTRPGWPAEITCFVCDVIRPRWVSFSNMISNVGFWEARPTVSSSLPPVLSPGRQDGHGGLSLNGHSPPPDAEPYIGPGGRWTSSHFLLLQFPSVVDGDFTHFRGSFCACWPGLDDWNIFRWSRPLHAVGVRFIATLWGSERFGIGCSGSRISNCMSTTPSTPRTGLCTRSRSVPHFTSRAMFSNKPTLDRLWFYGKPKYF